MRSTYNEHTTDPSPRCEAIQSHPGHPYPILGSEQPSRSIGTDHHGEPCLHTSPFEGSASYQSLGVVTGMALAVGCHLRLPTRPRIHPHVPLPSIHPKRRIPSPSCRLRVVVCLSRVDGLRSWGCSCELWEDERDSASRGVCSARAGRMVSHQIHHHFHLQTSFTPIWPVILYPK